MVLEGLNLRSLQSKATAEGAGSDVVRGGDPYFYGSAKAIDWLPSGTSQTPRTTGARRSSPACEGVTAFGNLRSLGCLRRLVDLGQQSVDAAPMVPTSRGMALATNQRHFRPIASA
jgi:hypothetical protein